LAEWYFSDGTLPKKTWLSDTEKNDMWLTDVCYKWNIIYIVLLNVVLLNVVLPFDTYNFEMLKS